MAGYEASPPEMGNLSGGSSYGTCLLSSLHASGSALPPCIVSPSPQPNTPSARLCSPYSTAPTRRGSFPYICHPVVILDLRCWTHRPRNIRAAEMASPCSTFDVLHWAQSSQSVPFASRSACVHAPPNLTLRLSYDEDHSLFNLPNLPELLPPSSSGALLLTEPWVDTVFQAESSRVSSPSDIMLWLLPTGPAEKSVLDSIHRL